MVPNRSCPTCHKRVYMVAVENQRNGKWTMLPLDYIEEGGDFIVYDGTSIRPVDIMGVHQDPLPTCSYEPGRGPFRAHPPSHYLPSHGDQHEVTV